jgi:hypothetical protein
MRHHYIPRFYLSGWCGKDQMNEFIVNPAFKYIYAADASHLGFVENRLLGA